MRKLISGVCAAAFLFASNAPLLAAPDNTLGAALLFAVVDGTGMIARGSGAISSTGSNPFTIGFDRDVTGCVYSATVGSDSEAAAFSGFADVIPAPPNGVVVRTRDIAGSQAPRGFHLIVFCAR